jgi:hypothetical protein
MVSLVNGLAGMPLASRCLRAIHAPFFRLVVVWLTVANHIG